MTRDSLSGAKDSTSKKKKKNKRAPSGAFLRYGFFLKNFLDYYFLCDILTRGGTAEGGIVCSPDVVRFFMCAVPPHPFDQPLRAGVSRNQTQTKKKKKMKAFTLWLPIVTLDCGEIHSGGGYANGYIGLLYHNAFVEGVSGIISCIIGDQCGNARNEWPIGRRE